MADTQELNESMIVSEDENADMAPIQNPPTLDANAQASQFAALLAFGRRSTSWSAGAVLLQDSVALLVDMFKADLGGFSEVTPDGRSATITMVRVDRQGNASTVVRRAIPLDPTRSMNETDQMRPRPSFPRSKKRAASQRIPEVCRLWT